jgi:hypothetical protein
MKKIIALSVLALAASSAFAFTFYVNGILFGTVCRDGAYYTVYPSNMAQPVGTTCPIRDAYGNIIGQGMVSYE